MLDFRQTLMTRRAERYASTVYAKGVELENCVGFINYTRIQMCRPGGENAMQRSVYSGHKRLHCLIYQTITSPDDLIFSMYGPKVGRRHDMTLYRQSKIGDDLQTCLNIAGRQFCIYGDPAYMLRQWLQIGF